MQDWKTARIRLRDRQTDRQTNKQADRQIDRQIDRQTDRQTDRLTEFFLTLVLSCRGLKTYPKIFLGLSEECTRMDECSNEQYIPTVTNRKCPRHIWAHLRIVRVGNNQLKLRWLGSEDKEDSYPLLGLLLSRGGLQDGRHVNKPPGHIKIQSFRGKNIRITWALY